MRNVPHPHSVSRHPALSANGKRGPLASSKLGPVRHGARRLSAKAHEPGRVAARIRLALSQVILPSFDLASASSILERGPYLPGRVLFVQAFQSDLAFFDQTPAGPPRLAPAGGTHQAAPS